MAVSPNAVAKNCHGKSAVKVSTAYGTPSAGNFAMRPKTTVKMTIVRKGRMKAQSTRGAFCLYRTTPSRQARKPRSSRYSHISPRSRLAMPRGGLMTLCRLGLAQEFDQVRELRPSAPPQLALRFRGVAAAPGDVAGAEEALVDVDVLVRVQPEMRERRVSEVCDRVRLAGGEDEVVGLVALEHPPHALDVLRRVAPVAHDGRLAEGEPPPLAARDGRRRGDDLFRHVALRAQRRLVVEEDAAAGEE